MSLTRKIERLRQQGSAPLTPLTFQGDYIVNKSNSDIAIFQPNISAGNHPNLVKLRRENVRLCNLVGDYIGDYYTAMKNKDNKNARYIYDQITAIETDRLDAKAYKKINDFMSKNKQ